MSHTIESVIESALWAFVSKATMIYLLVSLALGAANGLLARYTDIGRDDTDPPGNRSNLLIMTDHATGCQYLTSVRGGLTPRLDENGKQICIKEGGAA